VHLRYLIYSVATRIANLSTNPILQLYVISYDEFLTMSAISKPRYGAVAINMNNGLRVILDNVTDDLFEMGFITMLLDCNISEILCACTGSVAIRFSSSIAASHVSVSHLAYGESMSVMVPPITPPYNGNEKSIVQYTDIYIIYCNKNSTIFFILDEEIFIVLPVFVVRLISSRQCESTWSALISRSIV